MQQLEAAMFERVIVFPLEDNQGHNLQKEIDTICLELLEIVGGYSETRQRGQWRGNDQQVYTDWSARISTVVSEEQDILIGAKLSEWCARLRQRTLYTHSVTVEVRFIEPAKVVV
ncbi:MAG TPA: hypothetical protein VH599_07215 [Ktedonobacterales bacterium]|jgi:hypothetical protein